MFSKNLFHPSLLEREIIAFFIFCFLSGSVYILNDLVDLKLDGHHPIKSQRPFASHQLRIAYGVMTLAVLIPLLLIGSYLLTPAFFCAALLYLLLQAAYSFCLKDHVILDVFATAFGFILRVVAGALVIHVDVSPWLMICTILLALFIGLGKRRHELVTLGKQAKTHRKVLVEYTPYLLDQMISVVTAATIVSYIFYTLSEETIAKFGTQNLLYTNPFVLYGIFRYLYLIHKKERGGSPEDLVLQDKPLLISILLWILTVGVVLYG
jgi:4-hydroxybenzoate polyprenyltransferase